MSSRLEVECSTGYFLDHKNLINQSYVYSNEFADSDCYELKNDVFTFTEKENQAKGEPKRKKVKAKPQSEDGDKDNHINVEHIRKCSVKLIEACQDKITNLPTATDISIDAFLEDATDFPNFHGRNESKSFVTTTICNRQYIIPPNCVFHNTEICNLVNSVENDAKFDFIVLDPPWRNKYIRRLKAARSELSYKMLYNEDLEEIPLGNYIHENTLVAIWCTNSELHHRAIVEKFLPKWNLKMLAKWYWIKLNHKGDLVCPFRDVAQKQPFEHLFLATHKENTTFHYKEEFLISVASIIHSHKPPLLEIFKSYLPEKHRPRCLELFARYLYPGFTSVGLEVLKLQDIRLYDSQKKQQNE